MSTIMTTWSQGKMSKRRVGRQLVIVDPSQIGTMYETTPSSPHHTRDFRPYKIRAALFKDVCVNGQKQIFQFLECESYFLKEYLVRNYCKFTQGK